MNHNPLVTDPISLPWADIDNRVLDDPSPTSASSAEAAYGTSNGTLGERVERFEQEIIEDTLRRRGGHRQATAKELGISRVTLYNKMKKFGLLAPEPAAANCPTSVGTAAANCPTSAGTAAENSPTSAGTAAENSPTSAGTAAENSAE